MVKDVPWHTKWQPAQISRFLEQERKYPKTLMQTYFVLLKICLAQTAHCGHIKQYICAKSLESSRFWFDGLKYKNSIPSIPLRVKSSFCKRFGNRIICIPIKLNTSISMGQNGYSKTASLALGGLLTFIFSSIVCILPDRAFHMQDMKNDLCLKLRLGSHGVHPIRKCPVNHQVFCIFRDHPSEYKHCIPEYKYLRNK